MNTQNRYKYVLLIFLGGSLLLSTPTYTQNPTCSMNTMYAGAMPMDNCGNQPPGMPPGQRQKHIEQLRIFKLLELLDLDENQEIDFLQAFRTFRKQHQQLSKERSDIIDTLARGLRDSSLSQRQIYTLVEHVEERETALKQLEKTFLRKAKRILTADQYGRLVVFQHRFEYELLEGVRSFWERRNMRWRDKGGGRFPQGKHEQVPWNNQ